jgi:hypothetical protein
LPIHLHTFRRYTWLSISLVFGALTGRSLCSTERLLSFWLWLGAGIGGGALQIYCTDIVKKSKKRNIIETPFWVQYEIPVVGASATLIGMLGVMDCAFPGQYISSSLVLMAVSIFCIEYDWFQWIAHKAYISGISIGATWWLLFLDDGGDGDILAKR